MGAKKTKVTLEVNGATCDFELEHAERLLRMTKAGWHLPKNSKFEFVENGIRLKQNTKGDTRSEKCVSPGNGENTPATD